MISATSGWKFSVEGVQQKVSFEWTGGNIWVNVSSQLNNIINSSLVVLRHFNEEIFHIVSLRTEFCDSNSHFSVSCSTDCRSLPSRVLPWWGEMGWLTELIKHLSTDRSSAGFSNPVYVDHLWRFSSVPVCVWTGLCKQNPHRWPAAGQNTSEPGSPETSPESSETWSGLVFRVLLIQI